MLILEANDFHSDGGDARVAAHLVALPGHALAVLVVPREPVTAVDDRRFPVLGDKVNRPTPCNAKNYNPLLCFNKSI